MSRLRVRTGERGRCSGGAAVVGSGNVGSAESMPEVRVVVVAYKAGERGCEDYRLSINLHITCAYQVSSIAISQGMHGAEVVAARGAHVGEPAGCRRLGWWGYGRIRTPVRIARNLPGRPVSQRQAGKRWIPTEGSQGRRRGGCNRIIKGMQSPAAYCRRRWCTVEHGTQATGIDLAGRGRYAKSPTLVARRRCTNVWRVGMRGRWADRGIRICQWSSASISNSGKRRRGAASEMGGQRG